MISVTCSGCGAVLQAPDEAAGKRARCSHCKTVSSVPFKVVVQQIETAGVDEPTIDVQFAPIQRPPEVAAPIVPVPTPQPSVPAKAEYCLGCGQPMRNYVACKRCSKEYCSELCLERHEERCLPKKKSRRVRDDDSREGPTIIVNANSHATAVASVLKPSNGVKNVLGCLILLAMLFFCCIPMIANIGQNASTVQPQNQQKPSSSNSEKSGSPKSRNQQ